MLNNIITERGYLWRNDQERDKYIKLLTHQFVYELNSDDYFDLKAAQSFSPLSMEEHLHPSIITLAKDPFKTTAI